VVRAENFSDLLDLCDTLQNQRRLSGKRMAVLTSTGGAGTLIADNLGFQGFATPAPGPATATALRALQKGDEAILDRNPIDVTLAGLDPMLLRAIIGVLQDSDDYDGLVVVVGSSSLAMPDLVADAIRDCLPRSNKPIMAFVSPHAPHVVQVLRAREVPTFTAPESCAIACKALLSASQALPAMVALTDCVAVTDAPKGTLNEKQAADLMSAFGIPMAPSWVVETATQARALCQPMSEPVVLKILSNQVTHKSDIGGVVMHQTAETVGPSLDQMREQILRTTGLKIDTFLIQTQIQAPVSLILGARRDPLGMTIMVGAGGVLAELLQDSAVTILAKDQVLSKIQSLELLKQLKIWPLLMGYRGKPSMDIDALVCTLGMFSKMVSQLSCTLIEAEINPLLVQQAGLGVAGVDAVMRFDEVIRLDEQN
jgi:acetate---CoA ligase (ADP-forming)